MSSDKKNEKCALSFVTFHHKTPTEMATIAMAAVLVSCLHKID
jgi:hypothetical protein